MNSFNFDIPLTSGGPLPLALKSGNRLFIIGANGSGKSALIQHVISKTDDKKFVRITAHRQTWFSSGAIDLTPQSRRQHGQNEENLKRYEDARWIDHQAGQKHQAIFFDLAANENARARATQRLIDNGERDEAVKKSNKSRSPFDQLNELLARGNLKTSIENSEGEQLLAKINNYPSFDVAQMSDGERSAFAIAATVIVAEPETVFLIDEPERHLHRSIIVPFLSALFDHRSDCVFMISTHEIALPVADPEARVLMVRSCTWKDNSLVSWDIQLLEPGENISKELKRDILGSRKKILFVEGTHNSLDRRLYNELFPDVSVIPKGSCGEVEKAVKGLRDSQDHHHVSAFGLIDKDDRRKDKIEQLEEQSIFPLKVYSVEGLYYCSDAIAAVAQRQADSLGQDADEMIKVAIQQVLDKLGREGVAKEMAARRCERRVREHVLSKVPGWKQIQGDPTRRISVPAKSHYNNELKRFRKLVDEKKLDELVARYPLHKSDAFGAIANALKLKSMKEYKQTLLTQIRTGKKLAQKLKHNVSNFSPKL